MAVRISCLTAVVRKASVRDYYPGGVERFGELHRVAREDDDLVALLTMSGGELAELLGDLAQAGLRTGRDIAVSDMFLGELIGCAGVRVRQAHTRGYIPIWEAEVSD